MNLNILLEKLRKIRKIFKQQKTPNRERFGVFC
jgi:hypothetical protein